MQKKIEASKAKPKGYKILRGSVKHGITVQLSGYRRPLQTASFRRAVERSVAATKESGNPVAKYDMQRRQAYVEYTDETRAYVE